MTEASHIALEPHVSLKPLYFYKIIVQKSYGALFVPVTSVDSRDAVNVNIYRK